MDVVHKKVLFRYESPILDKTVVETMWAIVVDEKQGLYQLDNTPFYGASIAVGDEFLAVYDTKEAMLTYQKTTKVSGHSVIALIALEEQVDWSLIHDTLTALGCYYEGLNDNYLVVDVPKSVYYQDLKDYLEIWVNNNNLDYAEPCLSEKHWDDITV